MTIYRDQHKYDGSESKPLNAILRRTRIGINGSPHTQKQPTSEDLLTPQEVNMRAFIIKVMIATVIVMGSIYAFYYYASPYKTCVRDMLSVSEQYVKEKGLIEAAPVVSLLLAQCKKNHNW